MAVEPHGEFDAGDDSTPATRTVVERLSTIDDLGRQLIRFLRLIKRRGAQFSGQQRDGIEYAAYGLLGHLVVEGPQRTTSLADAMHVDLSTVSRQTAGLVRHGLLERRPDPVDGRACILTTTPEGERVFRDNRDRHNETMAKVLGQWPVADVRRLVALLDRLNGEFEARDRAESVSATRTTVGTQRREL